MEGVQKKCLEDGVFGEEALKVGRVETHVLSVHTWQSFTRVLWREVAGSMEIVRG